MWHTSLAQRWDFVGIVGYLLVGRSTTSQCWAISKFISLGQRNITLVGSTLGFNWGDAAKQLRMSAVPIPQCITTTADRSRQDRVQLQPIPDVSHFKKLQQNLRMTKEFC